jgi:hypothetical protein
MLAARHIGAAGVVASWLAAAVAAAAAQRSSAGSSWWRWRSEMAGHDRRRQRWSRCSTSAVSVAGEGTGAQRQRSAAGWRGSWR